MESIKCFICQNPIDFSNRQIPIYELVLDEHENLGRLCPECQVQINGKVAVIVEDNGIRSGEAIFLTRRVLKGVAEDFCDRSTIYIVPREGIKIIIKRILNL